MSQTPINQETSGSILPVAISDNSDDIANQLADAIFPDSTENLNNTPEETLEDNPIEDKGSDEDADTDKGDDANISEGSDENAEAGEGDDADEGKDTDESDDSEEGDDAILASNEKFSPAQQKAFNKAIGKAKQKYKDAKAQFETISSEKTELQSQFEDLQVKYNELALDKAVPPPSIDNPLAGQINSLEELQSFARSQFDLKLEIMRNTSPEGDSFVFSNGKDVALSHEKVKELLSEIERTISLDIPAHREFLKGDSDANSWLTALPTYAQKNSELNNAITAKLVEIPALKTIKGSKRAAFHLAIGERLAAKFGKDSWDIASTGLIPAAPAKAKVNRIPPKPITKKEAPVVRVADKTKALPKKTITTMDAEDFIASVI